MNTAPSNNNGCSNFDKCGACIDRLKPLLGLSLENRIYAGLETLVCESNSHYAKRFPRVKKCLDVVAAWGDYVDAFCTKDANTRTESITTTQVQREMKFLSTGGNNVQNTNVWKFINEKDFWLCQDNVRSCGRGPELSPQINSRVHNCSKGNQNSDLEVEVGSVVEEVRSRPYTSIRPNTCASFCCKKLDNMKPVKSQVCQQNIDFIFKLKPSKEIPEDTRACPRKRLFQKTRATMTSHHNYQRATQTKSKLRVFAHKSVSTDSLTHATSAKAAKISVPCGPSRLMVRTFDVDPSLSDSCLIRTRNFKSSIQTACSCLNNILQQLDGTAIREPCLNCKIRSSRIDLSLQRPTAPTFQLFLTRVPSGRNVQKSDKGQATTECCERSDVQEKQRLEDLDVRVDHFGEKQEGVTFYSPCSSNSLLGEEKMKPKKTVQFEDEHVEKVSKNEVRFVYPRKNEREADFVLSPSFRAEKIEDSATSGVEGVARKVKKDSIALFINKGKRKSPVEQIDVDTNSEIHENQFSKDSESEVEPRNSARTSDNCSSDSLKVCSSKQRSYSSFCAKDALLVDEKGKNDVQVHFKKSNLGDQIDSSSSSEEDTLETPAITSKAVESTLKPETKVQQGIINVSQKGDQLERQCPTLKLKSSILETKDDAVCPKKILIEDRSILGKNVSREDKISFKKKECLSEEMEKFSDFIGTSNSNYSDSDSDAKCSRCGKDLSGSEGATESHRVSTCARSIKKSPSLETIKTLIITTDMETKVGDANFSTLSSKCKTIHVVNKDAPVHNRPIRFTRVDPLQNPNNSPYKCPDDCQRNSSNNRYPEKVLAFTTRIKSQQGRSMISTELESFSENFRVSSSATTAKPGSPHGRSTLKSKLHSLRFRAPSSTKDLRGNRTTSDTQCKAKQKGHFPMLSRYRNRFWRGSIVPRNLCSSFPSTSVNQIKHLLRKKLRRLLMERDQGTSTSKTFLGNDSYLISISSGKLNERVAREPCCGPAIRCPFTARTRDNVDGQGETFSEKKLANRGKDGSEDSVKKRRGKMTKGSEILGNVRSVDASRHSGQKYTSESTGWRKFADEHEECMGDKAKRRDEFSCNCGGRIDRRSSVATFSSTKVLFVGKNMQDERMTDCSYPDGMSHDGSHSSRRRRFVRDSASKSNRRKCPGRNSEKVRPSRSRRGEFCDVFKDVGNNLRSYELRSFEKRLLDFGEEEGNDLARLLSTYEKRINNLSVDFRLKLMQYVALCRSVKDCLVTRLRSDDVCEVSSSSI